MVTISKSTMVSITRANIMVILRVITLVTLSLLLKVDLTLKTITLNNLTDTKKMWLNLSVHEDEENPADEVGA